MSYRTRFILMPPRDTLVASSATSGCQSAARRFPFRKWQEMAPAEIELFCFLSAVFTRLDLRGDCYSQSIFIPLCLTNYSACDINFTLTSNTFPVFHYCIFGTKIRKLLIVM